MSNALTREEVYALVRENETIQQIVAAEPEFQRLLDLAASPTPRYNRWVSYEALKRAGRNLVGWSARHKALRTGEHYQVMCWALDMLLPNDSLNPPPSDYYDRMWDELMQRSRRHNSDWVSLGELVTQWLPQPKEHDNDVIEEGA
jgi:hypothetical protein